MFTPDNWIEDSSDGCRIFLYVQPRASRTRVAGLHDGRLKVQIAAPPVDGAANKEIVNFLSGELGLRKSAIEITSGESGRRKTVTAHGVKARIAREKLEA